MNKFVFIFASIIFFALYTIVWSQSVSVSPSRLYFKELPGGYKSQKIRVTNNGSKNETFQVVFSDFVSTGNQGKTEIIKGKEYVHGLSPWLSASPAFFDLAAGATQEVEVLLQVPSLPEANNVRWAIAAVKLSTENTGNGDKGSDVTGMQILQTFQFLIHIFQTPPTVIYREAKVLSFESISTPKDSAQVLEMEVENGGETILDCAPYLDVVNLGTGVSQRIRSKGFSVLPDGRRKIKFVLPSDLPKGNYNIMGVIDFGSDTDLAGAELKIEIK